MSDEANVSAMMRILDAVSEEAAQASSLYGDFASMHEAYGVLAEEVEELFDAVRMKQTRVDPLNSRAENIRKEAIQVAAVALRIAEQAGRVMR
jgi:NTP pyrophosphatase (non-canonical NTP hydrolase)